ncbi:hypothetical protein V6R21_26190 [Limibacter armeniacum]|uniref:hypothetical protein n=1 Tax=Limibacter armeniacum TaxID=466084 RepID=UPI002FE67703
MTYKQSEKELLFERGSITLDRTKSPANDIVDIVSETLFGTPGSMRYRHKDTREYIHQIDNPYFLALRRNDVLLGTVTICTRPILHTVAPTTAYHVRYFAFNEKFRSTSRETQKRQKSNFLLDLIFNQLEAEHFPETGGGVFYAYVERENVRSAELCERFGFNPIRKMTTSIFSRMFPKKDNRVSRLNADDKGQMKQLLHDYYKGYSFFTTENLFKDDNYFVLKEGNEIVAGIQALPTHWKMEEMSGPVGALAMNLLPKLPILSRVFNPNAYNFLAGEGVYCKKGYEHLIPVLFEAVCAETGYYSINIWSDIESSLYQLLQGIKSKGVLERFNDKNTADVIVKYSEISEETARDIESRPTYISGFDLA